jgi:hypothetical protein
MLERHQYQGNETPGGGDEDNNQAKTLYSIGTKVDPGHARNYIIDLSKDIYDKLYRLVDTKNITTFPRSFHSLLRLLPSSLVTILLLR